MTDAIRKEKKKLYQCPACGLHYRDEARARECETWCNEHQSCNLEIIAQSVENSEKEDQPNIR